MVHVCFFFNDTATTEIYTLSLHDALPIFEDSGVFSLNFLDTEQEDLARRFSEPLRHEDGQVGGSSYTTGETGAPLFEEAFAHLECRVAGKMEAGDHTVYLGDVVARSEEHTSELQSRQYLVCRLLLEKKK